MLDEEYVRCLTTEESSSVHAVMCVKGSKILIHCNYTNCKQKKVAEEIFHEYG
jgi:hypothetical protein